MKRFLSVLAVCLLTAAPVAAAPSDLSPAQASGGIRDALAQGAGKAVDLLGRQDGFLGDPEVRIGLPGKLRKAEGMLRNLGLGGQTDELITTMNRAAEAAVPAAKPLLMDAVRQMTVSDARQILTGGDDAATRYFERSTAEPLAEKFKPTVREAMARFKLNEKFQGLAGRLGPLGQVKNPDGYLEDYVTRKTLDGLFLMIAQEEKAIRKNPASAAGSLAKKAFGSL